jgi:hypothetical protein
VGAGSAREEASRYAAGLKFPQVLSGPFPGRARSHKGMDLEQLDLVGEDQAVVVDVIGRLAA